MIRKLSRMRRDEKGITGLETAIILIAFVVVAAVFAYTALSAGLFSTQKSQEAVYSGLEETQSTLELRGGVIAYANSTAVPTNVGCLQFTVAIVAGGEPIDLTTQSTATGAYGAFTLTETGGTEGSLLISYSDESVTREEMYWTKSWVGSNDGDDMLELNEQAVITVWFHDCATGTWSAGTDPFLASDTVTTNETFRLEVKPGIGSTLVIERTTPSKIDKVMDMH